MAALRLQLFYPPLQDFLPILENRKLEVTGSSFECNKTNRAMGEIWVYLKGGYLLY